MIGGTAHGNIHHAETTFTHLANQFVGLQGVDGGHIYHQRFFGERGANAVFTKQYRANQIAIRQHRYYEFRIGSRISRGRGGVRASGHQLLYGVGINVEHIERVALS